MRKLYALALCSRASAFRTLPVNGSFQPRERARAARCASGGRATQWTEARPSRRIKRICAAQILPLHFCVKKSTSRQPQRRRSAPPRCQPPSVLPPPLSSAFARGFAASSTPPPRASPPEPQARRRVGLRPALRDTLRSGPFVANAHRCPHPHSRCTDSAGGHAGKSLFHHTSCTERAACRAHKSSWHRRTPCTYCGGGHERKSCCRRRFCSGSVVCRGRISRPSSVCLQWHRSPLCSEK